MDKIKTFSELGLNAESLAALAGKGFEEPTPIQVAVIPLLLKNDRDIIGQAQTGTGKTAAFALPIIEHLDPSEKGVQVLVLTPTRELAIQVSDEINSLKGARRIGVMPIYGGQSIEDQIRRLKKGIQIVVGTPGRILDHLHRKTIKLGVIRYLVLDEADEMLNMGFIEDVEAIMATTPEDKRSALFSATIPPRIEALSRKYLKDPETVFCSKNTMTVNLTDQIYYEVRLEDKFEALCRIIDIEPHFYGLIFCRTKVDVDFITHKLIERGYEAEGLHGDMAQAQRETILHKFRRKQIHVLAATDVAARGLDITNLTHVINFALPQDPESYVHRIGRTGRAGKKGIAITFITPSEYRKLVFIQRITKTDIRRETVPEVSEIIAMKKARIASDMDEIIQAADLGKYYTLVDELLEKHEAPDLVAALLKSQYESDLDENVYAYIKPVAENKALDNRGKTRLFIGLGKRDGYAPRKLVKLLTSECKMREKEVADVMVMNDFSFVTVPFEKAEKIIQIFKKQGKGNLPLVTKAREEQKQDKKKKGKQLFVVNKKREKNQGN